MALFAIDVGTDLAATTLTDLYTVTSARIFEGCVIVCNRGAATTFRISTAPGGAGDAVGQYKAYDLPIAANEVYQSPPLALPAGTVIRGYSGTTDVTMAVNGLERS